MAAGLLALLIAGTLMGSAADAARREDHLGEDRLGYDRGYHRGAGDYAGYDRYAPYRGYGDDADYGYRGYAPDGGYDPYGEASGYDPRGGGYDSDYGGGDYGRYGDDGW